MSDGEGAGEVSMGSAVEPRPITFMSWIFPFFWLVFIGYPLVAAWRLDGAARLWGLSLTLLFAAVFYAAMVVSSIGLGAFARHQRDRRSRTRRRSKAIVGAALAVLLLITVVGLPLIGEGALSFLAYDSVIVVIALRRIVPGFIAAASTLIIAEAAQRLVPGWSHDWSTTFGISIGGFGMVVGLVAGDRARAARAAEEENRRLEREAERLRLSQNVHDVLGHSLTVIALKAQLAAKLQAAGAPEAADHIGEIETLARGALADVRTTVQGVRRISLAEELVAATRALRSADIEVEAPTSVDAVDGQLRELFAWSVREGSTNILRHARARRCVISLDTDRLEIRNDGSGRGSDLAALGAGTGLRGLQERAESVGATVRTEKVEDRFTLIITRDRAPAEGAPADGAGHDSAAQGEEP
jgi:two-component system sensor histidine kinase DesK